MSARLIILGSSLTSLAVARDAHALGLQPIVVDTEAGIAFRSRRARSVLLPKSASETETVAQVLSESGKQDYLIATSDAWLKFLVANRAVLDGAYGTVLQANNAALEICLDKAKFGAWCLTHELSAPRIWRVGKEPRPPELAPPFLIRPAQTLHGALSGKLPKAVEAVTEAELTTWLETFASHRCEALVSESLLNQRLTQYSVPFVRTPGRTELFVARKVRPAPKHCSVGSYVELAPQDEAQRLTQRAIEALDYFGIGEAEVLYSESSGRVFLIEINARPWLQYPLAPASGHDFLGILIGRPRSMRALKKGRRWIDLPSDLFGALSSSIGAVRHGELGLVSYLTSLARANVYARFDWWDPAPAFGGKRGRVEKKHEAS